ncbi:integrase core domain-containing protein [Posidoniimonas polymericola]|uniref:integrase core domain-containing protein n=1 Tax=Posidoniimonas polymericola TaxID=2528002 RepID=UPI0011B580AF
MQSFESRASARKLSDAWREDSNHHRSHSSLGYVTPTEFAARCPNQTLTATGAVFWGRTVVFTDFILGMQRL